MKNKINSIIFALITTLIFSPITLMADEKEDLLVLRNTVVNLMQKLVEQGVMTPEQAKSLVETAQTTAASEVEEMKKLEQVPEDTVRVQYVPEIVKQEIRDQVRNELRAEVTEDVIKHAATNRWGVKDSLPGWLNKIKVSGDIRVRADGEYLDEDNSLAYLDVNETNDSRNLTMLNTRDDRERTRIRMRLAVDAKVNNSIDARIRLSSGNTTDPVSTNQTLGNSGGRYDTVIDQAYLKYKGHNNDGYNWLTAWAGRIPNPWFSSDLVWDTDLNFEGAAATIRHNFSGGDSLYDLTESNKEVFFTFGAFPLEEFAESSNDPWLFGAQLGGSYTFNNQSVIKLGAAYYHYDDLKGERAPNGSDDVFEYRVPEFFQQGNTLFGINDPSSGPLLGYAADYELLSYTGELDFTMFAPYRLTLTGEYVDNIGYDSNDVEERLNNTDYKEETTAYQFRADFGWPETTLAGNWKIFAAYKYIERDAVLDAFTDSDFHGGGTDAEGYVVGADYGIGKNAWLSFKWISTNEISGPEFRGIDCDVVDCSYRYDRAQIDMNAKF